jgi:TonB family protein
MYFDFDEYRPDISPVGRAISWREGILLSIIFHLVMVIVVLLLPKLFPFDAAAARRRALLLEQRDKEETPRFVFVQPRQDIQAFRAPPQAEPSDKDRLARTPERRPKPENTMPYSRGNSTNRVEQMDQQAARGRGPDAEPTPPQQAAGQPGSDQPKLQEAPSALTIPNLRTEQPQGQIARATPGGRLGDALRNLGRYVEREQLNNPEGGGAQVGPFQFDTKGVEFGPWLARFVAQVRRNWEPLIPLSAMSMKGHVVITFNIHKNGAITDVAVAGPCPVDGFNTAAFGAIVSSNPTYPLPPEYPSESAFFTGTFYYNEQPPR